MISPDEGTRRLELGSDAGFLMLMTVLIVGAWVGWSALPPMDHGAAAPAPAMAGRVPGAPVAAASPTGPSDRPTVRATVRPGMIRVATAIDILAEESPWFSPEADASLFAAAAVQIAAAIVLGTPDDDPERQLEIHAAAMDATTPDESRDGSVGPEAMARVLSDLTGQPFVLVIRPTRQDALRVAARANSVGAPAILLTWRGAHAWVMTGFRADADPVAVPDATITAARILDASYPVSSEVWGPSHPPGTLEGEWELERNYLPWEQPEGPHPARDGQFLLIVPAGVE